LPAVVTALLFSGSYVAGKFAVSDMGPLGITLCRYVVAAMFLSTLSLSGHYRLQRIRKRSLGRFAVLGLLGIVGYHYFFFVSLRYTDIANTAIINALSPVVTVILAFLFLRERLGWRTMGGILLAVVGVVILISQHESEGLSHFHLNPGDVCMLISVVCWAGYALMVRSMAGAYSGYTITWFTTMIGVSMLLPLAAIELFHSGRATVTMSALWPVLYMGIFASGIGYLLYNKSVHLIGATQTSGIVYGLVPIFTALWGYLLLDEKLSLYALASMLLIIVSLGLMLGLWPRVKCNVPS